MNRPPHALLRSDFQQKDIERFRSFLMPVPFCGCLIHLGESRNGYARFLLNGRTLTASRVAWCIENGDLMPDKLVLHTCDIRCCCEPSHLFTGCDKDNSDDKCAKGRQAFPKGELHGNAKITEAEAINIRRDLRPQRIIAADYGISQTRVAQIKSGKAWNHV